MGLTSVTAKMLMVSMLPWLSIFLTFTSASRVPLCQFTVGAFVTTLEKDTSLDDQADALLPICEELSDDEALRHCQRNVRSYWAYLAPQLYDANINNQEVFDWACSTTYGTTDLGALFSDPSIQE